MYGTKTWMRKLVDVYAHHTKEIHMRVQARGYDQPFDKLFGGSNVGVPGCTDSLIAVRLEYFEPIGRTRHMVRQQVVSRYASHV